jgi:hypothetical protein
MASEKAEVELKRLRREQRKIKEDEIFGGLSFAECALYAEKMVRINQIEIELAATKGHPPSA